MILRKALLPVLILLAAAFMGQAASKKSSKTAPPPTKVQAQDVIEHLELTIAWYRGVAAAEQLTGVPTDLVVRDTTLQRSLQALQLAFDFGRAEAAFLAAEKRAAAASAGQVDTGVAEAGASGHNLVQAASKAAERVKDVQSQIDALNASSAKAAAKDRPVLQARERELQSELVLAQQIQTTIQGMLNVVGDGSYGAGNAAGLLGQIATLERSVPEARHQPTNLSTNAKELLNAQPLIAKPAVSPVSAGTANAAFFHAESLGLIALVTDLITLPTRSRRAGSVAPGHRCAGT